MVFVSSSFSSYYDSMMKRAWNFRQEKKLQLAENIYRKILTLKPDFENAWVGLLYTLNSMEQFENVEKIADKLVVDYPQNVFVRKAAAWTYYNLGRYYDAVINYRYAFDKTGTDDMRIGLGLALKKIGKDDEAREICMQCKDEVQSSYGWKLCMGEDKHSITLTPSIYINQMTYNGESSKKFSRSVSASMDIFSDYGFGIFLSGRSLSYTLNNDAGSSREISSNISFYYASWDKERYSTFKDPDSFIWFGWTRIDPDLDIDTGGNYFSANLSKTFHRLKLDFGYGAGIYDDFQTGQFSISVSYFPYKNLSLNIKPVFLKAYGSKSDSITEFKDRFSMEAGCSYTREGTLISLSFYKGERWLYALNNGISVWTGDEEFDYGGGFLLKGKGDIFSPYFEITLDHVNQAYGYEKDYTIAGATLGFSYSF